MKYHTDVPSTIPSLHTWIRLRGENLQFLADASVRFVRGTKTTYVFTYILPLFVSFFIRLGLNKYEIEQAQSESEKKKEREREKFHRNIGKKGGEEHGSKNTRNEGTINISRMLFNKIERLVYQSSKLTLGRHRERGFYHRQRRVRYRRTNSGDGGLHGTNT